MHTFRDFTNWRTTLDGDVELSSLEGNELAVHPRYYGMKVVGVGGGKS